MCGFVNPSSCTPLAETVEHHIRWMCCRDCCVAGMSGGHRAPAGSTALRVGGEGAVSQGHTCPVPRQSFCRTRAGQALAVLQLRVLHPQVPKTEVSGMADREVEITRAEISYERYIAVTQVSEASQCLTAAATLECSFGITWTRCTAPGALP